ncbi:MAG: hypothetical protein AABX96_00315 [Nanoarchaeota archaeon]
MEKTELVSEVRENNLDLKIFAVFNFILISFLYIKYQEHFWILNSVFDSRKLLTFYALFKLIFSSAIMSLAISTPLWLTRKVNGVKRHFMAILIGIPFIIVSLFIMIFGLYLPEYSIFGMAFLSIISIPTLTLIESILIRAQLNKIYRILLMIVIVIIFIFIVYSLIVNFFIPISSLPDVGNSIELPQINP